MRWPGAGQRGGTRFAKGGRLVAPGLERREYERVCVFGGGRQILVALSTPSGAPGCLIHPR